MYNTLVFSDSSSSCIAAPFLDQLAKFNRQRSAIVEGVHRKIGRKFRLEECSKFGIIWNSSEEVHFNRSSSHLETDTIERIVEVFESRSVHPQSNVMIDGVLEMCER